MVITFFNQLGLRENSLEFQKNEEAFLLILGDSKRFRKIYPFKKKGATRG